jgi:hypothetical protein
MPTYSPRQPLAGQHLLRQPPPAHRTGLVIGQVKCINVNPPSMPPVIRWYGQNANGSANGHARTTQAQAAQDVVDWADGKEVAYVKQQNSPMVPVRALD